MRIATARLMPKIASVVLMGWLAVFLRIMRTAGARRRFRPSRSTSVWRNFSGAGGRIASAGASDTHVPHRGQCADHPGGRADEQGPDDEDGFHFVHERRELEEVVVELDHAGAQPLAEPQTEHRARQRNDQAPAHVMPGQLTVGVTHRLERGNLLALHRHDAVERRH